MISLEKKFLFIHIPKTGGNSIQNILKDYSEDELVCIHKHQDGIERFEVRNKQYNIQKHSTINQYKKAINSKLYKSLYKFSTIRNPWDLCISYYFSPHRGKILWNRDEFKKFIIDIPTIKNYIIEETMAVKVRNKLGLKLTDKQKSIKRDIDFLMKFENLNEDFKYVCSHLNIPFEKLPHRNKSNRSHYTKYYDDELIDLVRTRFIDEINYANYKYGE